MLRVRLGARLRVLLHVLVGDVHAERYVRPAVITYAAIMKVLVTCAYISQSAPARIAEIVKALEFALCIQ